MTPQNHLIPMFFLLDYTLQAHVLPNSNNSKLDISLSFKIGYCYTYFHASPRLLHLYFYVVNVAVIY